MRPIALENGIGIVGAGIAGSTAALELANRGVPVTVFEKRTLGSGKKFGPERSEITLNTALLHLDATDAITMPLTEARGLSLDNPSRDVTTSIPLAPVLADNPLVGIDHHKFLGILHERVGRHPLITVQDDVSVETVHDDPDDLGANIVTERGTEHFGAVVNAAGPGWRRLPFTNDARQQHYENAIGVIAYGRRYRGQINMPRGEHALLEALSVEGTGRTSWVTSSGEGTIEVIYSDYMKRGELGNVNRRERFKEFKRRLIEGDYIEIDEEGPQERPISGFIGLEPRKYPSGDTFVFHHGERGQYASPSVGDAIAPTVALSEKLAETIVQGGDSDTYEQVTAAQYNNSVEWAMTRTRMKASEVGIGFPILKALDWLGDDGKKTFLTDHTFPKHLLIPTMARYPSTIPYIARIAKEYLQVRRGK